MSIDDWRLRIDALDGELLRLLNERARIAFEGGRVEEGSGRIALRSHARAPK